jgi:hypothetical protein
MQSNHIGSVEFGLEFVFAISNRADDGSTLAFTPTHYDVIDNYTGDVILENQVLSGTTDRDIWRGIIDTRDILTDQTGPFEPNRTYSLVIKDEATDGPEENPATFLHYNFTVTGAYSNKLQRILALEGENLIVDNFVYDAGNNPTSLRVRIFESAEAALNATPGIDDDALPETGEIARYPVTQTFQTGRQLRQSHRSVIFRDRGDE